MKIYFKIIPNTSNIWSENRKQFREYCVDILQFSEEMDVHNNITCEQCYVQTDISSNFGVVIKD